MGHIYTTNLFFIYLKFKFNWVSYILSSNLIYVASVYHIGQCRFEELTKFFTITQRLLQD